MYDETPASRERVIIQELGTVNEYENLKDWPSGEFLVEAMLPTFANLLPSTKAIDWQTAARKALLVECGYLSKVNKTEAKNEVETVRTAWDNLVTAAQTKQVEDSNDLNDFFRSSGRSNHRQLQWAIMDCAPGCQFNLHAHPNLELVYCIRGELHEIRLDDDDNIITKSFETIEEIPNKNSKLKGPSLIGCQRPWRFGTLSQGNWLVNRVGTIHKSFTATNGEGCVLLTLWGGSHANIPEEVSVVTNAVQSMDRKLKTQCAGCRPTLEELELISETFLPDSERSIKPL